LTWKIVKRTKFHRLEDIDLIGEMADVDEYEAELAEQTATAR
jgi:hypothetical protein